MMRRLIPPLSAAALLAFFVLLLFYRLLFTDRALASGDILHYFYPYRDYAAAALRAGRIPLWNPYIFMGAPFLANPQAAALYPLHWPLSWLPVTRQLYWSGAIHAWILALGGYALMRRWGTGWLAAVSAGLMLAGSGFYGGLLGHINQMNGAAWLPWLLWSIERTAATGGQSHKLKNSTGRRPLALSRLFRAGAHSTSSLLGFSLFVALTLLAGHTQTTYINLFGVGAWLLARTAVNTGYRPPVLARLFRAEALSTPLLLYALGVLLGVLIAAAQLLPTLELSQLGLRSGGLRYTDATSFSLRPLLLHWTLLPSYGLRDLRVVFATLGYTEFVAYVGALGLLLAGTAVFSGRRPPAAGRERNRPAAARPLVFGLFFAGLGLFLALGRWNPFTFLFYHLIPGFDLFRAPARWMMLYTLGMAALAGVGAERIERQWSVFRNRPQATVRREATAAVRAFAERRKHRALGFLLLAVLALDLLLAARALPHTQPTAPQAVYDVRTASAHLLTEPQRTVHPAAMGRLLSISEIAFEPGDMPDWRRVLRGGAHPQLSENAFTEFVIALKSQEILAPNLSLLWRIPTVDGFDGGVLPLQRYNAFLSLLIPPEELAPDGRVREQLQEIPPAHILELMDVRFVITDKVRDVWFDDIYYDRQIGASLTAKGEERGTAGERRRGERTLPRLFRAEAHSTTSHSSPLTPRSVLTVEAPYSFEATTVAIVGFVTADTDSAPAANLPLAEVTALVGGERRALGRLVTGEQAGAFSIESPPDARQMRSAAIRATGRQSPPAPVVDAPVVYRDGETGRQEYLARLPLPNPARLDALEIALQLPVVSGHGSGTAQFDVRRPQQFSPAPHPSRGASNTLPNVEPTSHRPLGLTVQAVTLIDERTRTFVPLLPSDRGRFRRVHSGDVKIYERLGGSGRVQLFGSARPASSLAEAVTMLRASDGAGGGAVVEADAETVAGWGLEPPGESGEWRVESNGAGHVPRITNHWDSVSNAPGPAALARQTWRFVSYAPERVVIRARSDRPGLLVLKDAYYPGWRATVNGEPVEVYPTNALFRGVYVPAGESEVIFWYSPHTWRTGLWISLAGAALWLLLALGCLRPWAWGRARHRA